MYTKFELPSSDKDLLKRALQVAEEFVQPYLREDVTGIVFLGGIARGYFDRSADIDIALFTEPGAEEYPKEKFYNVGEFEVQCWVSEYQKALADEWDMSRRWTYTQSRIYHDPAGKTAQLLAEKVPLKQEERKWLLMSGLTLSEWYINRLTETWVERGSIASAHYMFEQGLDFFFRMLFGFNNQLVADMKWRLFSVAQLEHLPTDFSQRIQDILIVQSITLDELARRREAFMVMWKEMKPLVEGDVGKTFEEMMKVV
ncbi:MAG: hypothetical protein JXA25_18755 [Anaerolineales bacterium]|nr:hypothetical protein [Anaerolineales bacterium]